MDNPLRENDIMSTISRKRFTKEFKQQAVELVKLGQPIREVAAPQAPAP